MQPPSPTTISLAAPTRPHSPMFLQVLVVVMLSGACLGLMAGCKADRAAHIATALSRGAAFLHSIQRPSGELSDILNPLFNTWETVEAAKALLAVAGDKNDRHLKTAQEWLLQQASGPKILCHNTACQGATCLETTAAYLLYLSADGTNAAGFTKRLSPSIATIRPMQQTNGAWEIGNPDVREATTFPSVSGFALSILNLYAQASDSTTPVIDSIQNATITWILGQQTAKGDWGSTWEYYGCPGYALWAILRGLQPHAHGARVAAAIDKASQFIRATQTPDGSWYHSLPPNPQQHGTASIKQTSPALQTALMLAALLATQPPKNDTCLTRGIDFLLDAQTVSGAWDGGFFPIPHARYEKREYIFATSMALQVLAAYRDLHQPE